MLVIVDRNESGLYETELALSARHPDLNVVPILGPIQNRALMGKVFKKYGPQAVFHAAAYKHVPMMEVHPWEAVFNNIVGTQTLFSLCDSNGVERWVDGRMEEWKNGWVEARMLGGPDGFISHRAHEVTENFFCETCRVDLIW